jgi:hypothetical protein
MDQLIRGLKTEQGKFFAEVVINTGIAGGVKRGITSQKRGNIQ